MNLKVSVVIPCLNEHKYIENCLRSVLNSFDSGKFHGDIWLVDGMSDDGTRELVKALNLPDVNLIDNPKRTTPGALNIGIKNSQGEVVIILGAHSEVHENFISENLRVLSEHEECGCVGGVIENQYTDEIGEAIGAAMSSRFGVGNARFRTGGLPGYVDTVAFGAYRRAVFERVGYFDEELIRNQDDEFNYRLIQSGFRIYFDPAIRSLYHVRASFSKLAKQYDQYGYWKVYVNKKHRTVTSIRQLAPLALFLLIYGFGLGLVLDFLGFGIPNWFRLNIQLGLLTYFLGILIFTYRASRLSGFSFAMKVAQGFFTLHYYYGKGYFFGILDFVIMNKRPSKDSVKVTR